MNPQLNVNKEFSKENYWNWKIDSAGGGRREGGRGRLVCILGV